MKKYFIFDIDGTITQDNRPIDGAVEVIEKFSALGIPFVFVTNTTSKSSGDLHRILTASGITAEPWQVINPVVVVLAYLRKKGYERIAIHHCKAMEPYFQEFEITDNNPQAVLIADEGDGIEYDNVNMVFRHILNGAEPLALQKNKYYVKEGEFVADIGFYTAGLEYLTGKIIKNLGKPSHELFEHARMLLGAPALNDIAIAGDDIEVDVLAAQEQGLFGILVKTGKYRSGIEANFKHKPDMIVGGVKDILLHLT